MVRLTRESGCMFQPLPSLQDIVDLEAEVIDLCIPLHGHEFRKQAGIATSLGEVEDHVLDQRPTEEVVVLERGPLVEELVILARGASAVKLLPLQLELSLLLRIILLALRILNCAAKVIVVEVVLLHKCLPVLVSVQPLRLRQKRNRRVLEGNPQCPSSVLQNVLRLLHGLPAAGHCRVKEFPASLLALRGRGVVLSDNCVQEGTLLRVEVLQALQHLLVADLPLPLSPVDRLGRHAGGAAHERRDGAVAGAQHPELLLVGLPEGVLLQGVPPVTLGQDPAESTAQHLE
mmetsp:Transcript_94730/g.277085  ORF Transcript_94730/g.277085 Transcript_94730/m.277085 type:complete len:289 (-) Transcript_94730:73-939(-)